MSDHMDATHGVSHLGIGVTDIERSIAFYNGVLGFPLVDRYTQTVPVVPGDVSSGAATRPRDVALVRSGHHDSDPVIVLSTPPDDGETTSIEIDGVGTHHCAFWVTGIEDYVQRLEAANAHFVLRLRTFENARGWGLPTTNLQSCMVLDPDGTILQLDERVVGDPSN